jgi:REP element-mobilizing transposase RayT
MARKPRIQYEGALYHVIVRGNQRQDIFLEDADRHEYLERLLKYKQKCGFNLYAYMLMSNHVHLLIETPIDPISRIMQMINFTYTQYFNRKYRKVGHLFQGRYKAILCDKDNYLLALVRYIHLNPMRAGSTRNLDKYPWSSHIEYETGKRVLADTDKVLRLFSESPTGARRKYVDFINSKLEEDISPYAQQILGDDRFVEKVTEKTEREDLPVKKPTLKTIIAGVSAATGVEVSEMISRRRDERLRVARGIFVILAREFRYSIIQLQDILNRDDTVISRMAESGRG